MRYEKLKEIDKEMKTSKEVLSMLGEKGAVLQIS